MRSRAVTDSTLEHQGLNWIKFAAQLENYSMPKTVAPQRKTPSRKAVLRSVASSTAVETGQNVAQLERRLERPAARFSHIKLAR